MNRNRRLVVLIGLVSTILNSCGVNSRVTLNPNETFVLGELQDTPFKTTVSNPSGEKIGVVLVNSVTQVENQNFKLDSDSTMRVVAMEDQAILLQNASNTAVEVVVHLNRNVQGMRFQHTTNSQ